MLTKRQRTQPVIRPLEGGADASEFAPGLEISSFANSCFKPRYSRSVDCRSIEGQRMHLQARCFCTESQHCSRVRKSASLSQPQRLPYSINKPANSPREHIFFQEQLQAEFLPDLSLLACLASTGPASLPCVPTLSQPLPKTFRGGQASFVYPWYTSDFSLRWSVELSARCLAAHEYSGSPRPGVPSYIDSATAKGLALV